MGGRAAEASPVQEGAEELAGVGVLAGGDLFG